LEEEVKKLTEEKKSAESAVGTYRQAFESELLKRKNEIFSRSLFKSRNKETVKALTKKFQQLHTLANDLADTVVDREENVKHLKEVKKYLGMRVKQIEEENNNLRQKLGMPALEPQGSNYLKKWNRRANTKKGAASPVNDTVHSITNNNNNANSSIRSPSDEMLEEAKQ